MKKTLLIWALLAFSHHLIAQHLEQGLKIVNDQQKQGVIDAKGRYVLKPKYERILPVSEQNIQAGFIVTKAQKYALYNTAGKPLTGFDYQLIHPQADATPRILAKKQGKYGYLDLQGKEAIPFVYDWALNFQVGSAKVKQHGVFFEIDKTGAKFEKKEKEAQKYIIIENQPMPIGGYKRFYRNIYKNLRYPPLAERMGIEGKVYVQFIVEKDGSLTDFKVLKGLGHGCDEEVIRVLKTLPKWMPTFHRGVPKRFIRSIPIVFKLKKK